MSQCENKGKWCWRSIGIPIVFVFARHSWTALQKLNGQVNGQSEKLQSHFPTISSETPAIITMQLWIKIPFVIFLFVHSFFLSLSLVPLRSLFLLGTQIKRTTRIHAHTQLTRREYCQRKQQERERERGDMRLACVENCAHVYHSNSAMLNSLT